MKGSDDDSDMDDKEDDKLKTTQEKNTSNNVVKNKALVKPVVGSSPLASEVKRFQLLRSSRGFQVLCSQQKDTTC